MLVTCPHRSNIGFPIMIFGRSDFSICRKLCAEENGILLPGQIPSYKWDDMKILLSSIRKKVMR